MAKKRKMREEHYYEKTPKYQLRPEFIEELKQMEAEGLVYLYEGGIDYQPGDGREISRYINHRPAQWKATAKLEEVYGSRLLPGQEKVLEVLKMRLGISEREFHMMNQTHVEAAIIETKLERQYSRAFKVFRWSDQSQPEAWMWLPIPTYPNCEHGPFPTKEEAKQAGEEAGYRFEGYEE